MDQYEKLSSITDHETFLESARSLVRKVRVDISQFVEILLFAKISNAPKGLKEHLLPQVIADSVDSLLVDFENIAKSRSRTKRVSSLRIISKPEMGCSLECNLFKVNLSVVALLDTGATDNLMDEDFVVKNNIPVTAIPLLHGVQDGQW